MSKVLDQIEIILADPPEYGAEGFVVEVLERAKMELEQLRAVAGRVDGAGERQFRDIRTELDHG